MKAQRSTPVALQHLADENAALRADLAAARKAVAEERAVCSHLRKAVAELSLKLAAANEALSSLGNVTPIRPRHRNQAEHFL